MKKFMFVALLALSLVVGGVALADNSNTVNSSELGIGYGAYTGLAQGDVRMTAANIIRVAMQLLGIVAVVIVLIGGFKWMTAGGNDEQVGEAKKWIFSGIIGLALILSAYAISRFALESLVNAANYSNP